MGSERVIHERNGLGVFELVDRLRRGAFIERQLIRHLAGWFVAAPAYEFKHIFGYHAWNHAEHADWIRQRLELLRGGHAEVNIDPHLEQWMAASLDAPGQYAFIRGTYQVVGAALLDFYEDTLARCDASANAYDRALLKRLIPEIRDQVNWAKSITEQDPDPEVSGQWQSYLSGLLEQAGGIAGEGTRTRDITREHKLRSPFRIPDHIVFDERISDKPLLGHAEKMKLSFEEAVVAQFRVFFNEVYAASMAATIVFETFTKNVPWTFIYDLTRQFWDETRHSEFGAVRLRELGLEPDRCNQVLFRYSVSMPFINRLCYLTMVLEPHFMPRKKPRFREYEQAGDYRSQLFADHDWSDEINHVKYGKLWLDRLLEDDARDIEVLKEETRALINQLAGREVTELSPF